VLKRGEPWADAIRRPRIDKEVLEQHHEGLVALAACLSGEVALYLRQGNYEAAKASAAWFARTFGPNGFWLEVQNHGLPEEKTVTEGMFRLGDELGLPRGRDAHYLKRDDAEAHDVLLAIGTGKDLDDPKRFRFVGQESYVKSEKEMRELFGTRSADVLAETARVANLCEFDFEKRYFLPQYPRPAEFATDQDLLVHLARAGAAERYGNPLPEAVEKRLEYELDVITRTGYAGYFLIVYDLIKAARDRGIPVGPGRGSAAGSLIAYALHITTVDPPKFDRCSSGS
jgi:DNA polymerase-3 subunit alpha